MIAVLAIACLPTTGAAEPWKTTIEVVLRTKPGERQRAVTKLPAGTTVVIEREEGRWLRVRAGKHVGYLTRTTIADAAPPPAPPAPAAAPGPTVPAAPSPSPSPSPTQPEAAVHGPSNRWSADRVQATQHGSTGLFVGVTAPRASLHAEARADAAKLAEVERGARLPVLDAKQPGWIHVRDAEGHEGWIARADVDNGSAGAVIERPVSELAGAATSRPVALRAEPGRIVMRAGAAVGYRSLGMDFTSNGSAGLANYLVSADAAAANAEVEVAARVSSRLRVGVDGRVQVSTSAPGPGIDYFGPSRAGGKIPFSTFAVDGGVRAGLRFRRVFELALRGGVHYDAFIATDVDNAGSLPRERLFGGTLGVRAEIMPPDSRVTVGLQLDALVVGDRRQTPGLEDGASSDASAMWAGATIRYLVERHFSVFAAYDFARATTTWSGMSVRTPGVTEARRVDSSQLVQIGVSAEL